MGGQNPIAAQQIMQNAQAQQAQALLSSQATILAMMAAGPNPQQLQHIQTQQFAQQMQQAQQQMQQNQQNLIQNQNQQLQNIQQQQLTTQQLMTQFPYGTQFQPQQYGMDAQ